MFLETSGGSPSETDAGDVISQLPVDGKHCFEIFTLSSAWDWRISTWPNVMTCFQAAYALRSKNGFFPVTLNGIPSARLTFGPNIPKSRHARPMEYMIRLSM